MIIQTELDEDGEEILIYTPENEADTRKIMEMEAAGDMDTATSFGDDRLSPADKRNMTAGMHKFATTQLELGATREYVSGLAARIPDNLVHPVHGREMLPHLTLMYGVTDDPQPTQMVVRRFRPIKVELGDVGVFEGVEDGEADAVFLNVHSPELMRLREEMENAVPHETPKKPYHPHVTLAYVLPGMGKLVAKQLQTERQSDVIQAVTFRGRTGASRRLYMREES